MKRQLFLLVGPVVRPNPNYSKQSSVVRLDKRCFQMHSIQGPTIEDVEKMKDDLYGKLTRENIRQIQKYPIPKINNAAVKEKRSLLFTEEKKRQFQAIGRIEKIDVDYLGSSENTKFLMNKMISTPYNCARHLGDLVADRSVAAEVNGQLWDMHRPLENSCSLKFLNMKMKDGDPFQVNRIFWRSCSFMLGCVAERAFKDQVYVELHSFPPPNVRSGSFVYDIDLKLDNWKPNSDEMRVLSSEMIKLSREKLYFERLEVDMQYALEMFQDNKYKREQIPEIAQTSQDGKTICLYRIGDFVDISRGPLMTHTGLMAKCTVTAVHPLPQAKEISETLYRIQGVALPADFLLNHFAYGLIEERGRKLNSARLPGQTFDDHAADDKDNTLLRDQQKSHAG